jgi:hypothetical protein
MSTTFFSVLDVFPYSLGQRIGNFSDFHSPVRAHVSIPPANLRPGSATLQPRCDLVSVRRPWCGRREDMTLETLGQIPFVPWSETVGRVRMTGMARAKPNASNRWQSFLDPSRMRETMTSCPFPFQRHWRLIRKIQSQLVSDRAESANQMLILHCHQHWNHRLMDEEPLLKPVVEDW